MRWMPPAGVLALIFLLQCALLLVVVTPNWDGAFYYAYARSVVFDGDLALANDLQLAYPTAGADFVAKQLDTQRTVTGRVATPFAIGSALLWLPLLAALRLLALAGQALGLGVALDSGYEPFYLAAVNAFSALLGLAAFGLTYRLARAELGRGSALLGVATLMLATPLLYYQFRDPLYSHTASAFVTALVVTVWWRAARGGQALPGTGGALLLGGLIGLASLVRWQHVVYLALPVSSAVGWWWALPAGARRGGWSRPGRYLLLVGGAAFLVLTPQLAFWRLFFGSWLTVPQGGGFLDWRAGFLGPLLFSSFRGLLAWMPIFFFGVAGLLLLARRRARLALPLLLVLALETYVNASTADWFAGGGFGPRRYTSELLILGVGYAAFLAALRPGWRYWLGVPLGVALAWQQWILLRFGLVENLGGQVVSMAPDFAWQADGLVAFARQLAGHVPALWQTPADFLVLAGSPLDLWLRHGLVPWAHGWGLLAAAGVLAVGYGLVRSRPGVGRIWWWAGGVLLLILLADGWILWLA